MRLGDIIFICDVQNRRLTNGFKLTRVGVTGVMKPVKIKRPDGDNVLTCYIDIFVDLPSDQKGSHLSRNLEAVAEMVDESVARPVSGLEMLTAMICRTLLDRHEYASYAEVRATADYFSERSGPSGKVTLEPFKLISKATARRGNGMTKSIGVEVIGMTACPCAMETVKQTMGEEGYEPGDFPTISHNQRNVSSVLMEVPEEFDVEADDLISIVEDSFSSPTYELLKRGDEGRVVRKAHENPKFVEDVVRDILGRILARYQELPDDVLVTVRSESEESIHKHNAFAEMVTTLGELRSG